VTEPTVKCPACGKTVTPRSVTSKETPAAPAATTASGERWSFAWRPPSGSICPECLFPLERYLRRRPWILAFRVGVVFATVAILLQLGVHFGSLPASITLIVRIAGVIGVVGLVVGGAGMLLGGRRSIQETV
jgi:hypothetical protein